VIQGAVAGKIDCEEFTREMNTEESPLLHPEMARIYRVKITELARASSSQKADVRRQIELRGKLATMLDATVQTKRSPESDDLSLHVSLVAGARNQHYLQLWRPTA
jgi:hypothetical protein